MERRRFTREFKLEAVRLGENFLAPIPTAVYGATLVMPAVAYYLLQKAIIRK